MLAKASNKYAGKCWSSHVHSGGHGEGWRLLKIKRKRGRRQFDARPSRKSWRGLLFACRLGFVYSSHVITLGLFYFTLE